jgi:caspase domain-containing protein/WD40 repeat protein
MLDAQVADNDAGTIEIRTPTEWANGSSVSLTQTSRSLYLTGRVDHPSGIEAVVVDGLPFFKEVMSDGSFQFEGWVTIEEGMDHVEVRGVARDGASFVERYALTVDLPDADASDAELWDSALSGFKGERWAVVVGISEYAHPDIPGLQFADRDAEQFAQFLVSDRAGLGGFNPDNVTLLTNEEATFRRLRRALYDFLKRPNEDDVIYVFWAGHGTPDPDRLNDLYLLPYDAEPDNIASTAFLMEDLQDALARTLARSKIVITDACHSAGVGFSGTRAALGINQINDAFLDRLAMSGGGTIAITSSRATEISREGPQWGGGHGVFTHYLLEGLSGAADSDNDRIVDMAEMYEYARTRVRRDTDNAQTPTMSLSPFNTSWPMSAVLDVSELATTEVRVDPPVSTLRSAMMMDLMDGTWSVPDSLNGFVGIEDTVNVHLDGRAGPVVDGSILTWGSSNTEVARVSQDGVIRPIAPGITTISASYFSEKRVEIALRVYDRPVQIEFSPVADTIALVRGDQVRLSVSMELPTSEIVRGMLPTFEIVDSLVVTLSRNDSDQLIDGQFRGIREGYATIVGKLAGQRHEWVFDVQAPGLVITDLPRTLLAGTEVDTRAHYTRADGTILTAALGVSWQSTDSTVVNTSLGGIETLRPGRAKLIASVGATRDTVSLTVLGDLILSLEEDGRSRIATYSVDQLELTSLLEDQFGGTDAVLSPDGSQIAFLSKREDDPAERIYVMDSDGTNIRRLLEEKRRGFLGLGRYYEFGPTWSDDGSRIYFSSNRDGNYDVYSITRDGDVDELERVSDDRNLERDIWASRDSPRLVFERVLSDDDSDIILTLADGAEPMNLTADRRIDGLRRGIKESRPRFLPNSGSLLLVEQQPGSNGQALVQLDINSRRSVGELVEAQGSQEILYAVSPLGDRIAYQQRPRGSDGAGRVVIADLAGNALNTFTLPAGLTLTGISWGAVPATSTR